jgi:PAS domain S-box-containing protein
MTGYDVADLVGRPKHTLLHRSHPDGTPHPVEACPILAAMVDGAVHHVSGELFWRKDGEAFPVEYTSTPIREKGKISGAVVIFQDISERDRADEERRLLQTMALAIWEAEDETAALQVALRLVCEATGWSFGQAWVPSQNGTVLACSAAWYAAGSGFEAFRAGSERQVFGRAEGLPGRAWAEERPIRLSDSAWEHRSPRVQAARAVGLVDGLAVPVRADHSVAAVLEFFLTQPRPGDERSVAVVAGVAPQLGSLMQRKRTESEQRQLLVQTQAAEARFRTLLESAPDGIILWDADGHVALANHQAEVLFGYPPGELIGQPVEHLVPERYRRRHVRHRSGYLTAPRTRPMGVGLELYGLRKDGSEFPVEISLSPVHADGTTLVVSVVRDVTERAALLARERSARHQEERLAAERVAVLGQIADGVLIADPAGQLTFANAAARRMLGIGALGSIDQPLGSAAVTTPEGQLLAPDEQPLAVAWRRRQPVLDVRLRIFPADGSEVFVECGAAPVRAEGGSLIGTVMTLHDVTAREELERHKDEFFANVSHDLRTPLAVLKASIGVVLANEPPGIREPLHRMLVNIDDTSDRMTRLVEGLLELTRLRAGRVQLPQVTCDLADIAQRAVAAVEPLAQTHGQRIEQVLPGTPLTVLGDPERLEQAVLNLLSNAQKYSPDGRLIQVVLERRGSDALLSIRDQGPGIPEVDRERIFERYYRSSAGADPRTQGSGLGLPIARALVELHGGHLWAENNAARGATFLMSLPLAAGSGTT